MPYATQQAMVDRFGETELAQLTDRTGASPPVLDPEVLARATTDADQEVDSYVSTRYVLPLPEAPGVLVRVACDLARFNLYGVQATEEIRSRAKDARDFLRRVAKGEVSLGLQTAPPTVESPVVDAPARTFSMDTLEDF